MCHILDSAHKYVPAISEDRSLILPNGKVSKSTETNMWQTLFGDQLTVTRARGAIDIRFTDDSEKDKLHGLIPVVEDWHTRMTFLKVSTTLLCYTSHFLVYYYWYFISCVSDYYCYYYCVLSMVTTCIISVVCLQFFVIQVIWSKLYSAKSVSDKGTLFQLRNVINRTSVPNDPKIMFSLLKIFWNLYLWHTFCQQQKRSIAMD